MNIQHRYKIVGRRAVRVPVADLIQDNARQPEETPHQKVFRLVGERRFEEAARLATRLINAGDVDGFFVHSQTHAYAKAKSWFDGNVAKSLHEMDTKVHTITPPMAQVALEHNVGNRKVVVDGLVKRMRDIVNGRWALTGQGLIFATSGELNDGQHRAWAVLLTSIPIQINVCFGALRETVVLVDDNKPRTGANRFHFAGVKNYAIISAMVGLLHRINAGRSATEAEKLELYNEMPDVYQSCASMIYGLPRGTCRKAFGVAAIHLVQCGADEERIREFFAQVKSGVGLTKRSPSLVLREAIKDGLFKFPVEQQVYHIVALFAQWAIGGKVPSTLPVLNEMPKVKF